MEAEAGVTPTSLPPIKWPCHAPAGAGAKSFETTFDNRDYRDYDLGSFYWIIEGHAHSMGAHLIDPCEELETKGQGAFQ